MTFGKDTDPREAGRKGGKTFSIKRSIKRSESMKKRWKNSNFRKRMLEKLNKNRNTNYSEMGKKSTYYENIKSKEIEKEFDLMFKPNEVCDRICIKENKIIFIEIKGKNKALSHKQKVFREFCKNNNLNYRIEFI